MPFQLRSSKFRHVFGSASRKEKCYENVKITRNAHDSNFCTVNPKFLAVVVESAGGGSFICVPLHQTGRVDVNTPRISGHAGNVMDIKWSPFSDYTIASCSDDNSVKVWQVPENGLTSNLTEWLVDLHGHSRRVSYIEWHPTAENILLSAGLDFKCVLWNIEQAEPINIIDCHDDTIFSMSWKRDGSLFATTCKDRKLRIIDPRIRTVAMETQGHAGNKSSKVVFSGHSKVLTTGFDRMSNRQLALWDVKNFRTPLTKVDIDNSSGVTLPFYDYDNDVIYIAGKGDGNIRYFEVVDDSIGLHFLNQYQSPFPQRGLGLMPKRGCDTSKCEVMRFYKLLAAKDTIEPISMIVPRKSDKFHEDIFPPTASMIPSLSADEWTSGQNRDPILVSLLDGNVTNSPKSTLANAVQKKDGSLAQTPTITTYKAMSPPHLDRVVPFPPPHVGGKTGPTQEQRPEPASLKNIKCLSSNEDYVSLSDSSVDRKVKPLDLSKTHSTDQAPRSRTAVRKVWTPTSPAGKDPTTNGFSGPDSGSEMSRSTHSPSPGKGPFINPSSNTSNSPLIKNNNNNKPSPPTQSSELLLGYTPQLPDNQNHKIHIRKVWASSPPSSLTLPTMHLWQEVSLNESELRKAYFSQMEEIKSLKEQITLKDKRIRLLEEEMTTLKTPRCGPGESDC